MPAIEVSNSLRIAATPARVWRALTDPAELVEWYAPGCRWEIERLAIGAAVRFFNSETDIQPATIESLVSESILSLRWSPEPELPQSTLLTTYKLAPTSDGTVVTLTHSGYESVPDGPRAAWISADESAVPAIVSALSAYASATS